MNHAHRTACLGAAVLTWTLLFTTAVAAAPQAATSATPATASEGQTAFRYRLKALGASAGEAVLTVGEPLEVGKRKLRSIRLEAKTSGLAGRVYAALGDGTSWVDGSWLPVRSVWRAVIKGGKRYAESKYERDRIVGQYEREGRPTRKINHRVPGRATDVVSAFIWLAHQPLKAGDAIDKRLHDGNRTYRLKGVVGEASSISVPLGVRDAVPVKMELLRAGKVIRHITYWIGADDRMPYKVTFDYGALGNIDAELIGHRKLAAAKKTALAN